MDRWREIEIARHPERPRPPRYVERLIDSFTELRGDRAVLDDPGIMAGVGVFRGRRVAVIAHRPRTSEAGAAGLRKALRVVALAERFDLSVLSFVDVAGRHGGGSAQGGMWTAVGACLEAFMRTPQPTVAVLCGQGVSGGALALCVADRLIAMEHAFLVPHAPEAVSAIIWRDDSRAREAARMMELTSEDLMRLGLCTMVVAEGQGAHTDPDAAIDSAGAALEAELTSAIEAGEARTGARRRRYRDMAAP